jgi:hypothetical protein
VNHGFLNAPVAGVVALAVAACTSHPTEQSSPALSLFSQTTDFGATPVGGRSEPLRFTIANRGEAPSGILSVAITGPAAAEYLLVRDQCSGQAVQEAASCLIEIELRPTVAGAKEATLTFVDPRGPDVSAILHGSAADAGLSMAPATHAFGPTSIGAESTVLTLVVRNFAIQPSGTMQAVLAGSHPGDFTITRDTCSGQALPLSGGCVIDVRFSPVEAGARQATVTVSASPGGSVGAALAGVGG